MTTAHNRGDLDKCPCFKDDCERHTPVHDVQFLMIPFYLGESWQLIKDLLWFRKNIMNLLKKYFF